ncbi:hypothetical protein PG614_05875 [Riemerella anatipestifer]|nr:hypothetical protein [Riemerella anatipestifer]MDY3532995.1 hypothetical protein [Riemerella anatipestifer]MDY3535468.1 hypothetical protein [Riemerella anatipestifer]
MVPPIFIGGFFRLFHFKFSFHQYLLKAPLFCLKTWSFLLGAFSVQRERYALSVFAFPLVLCVFREGRRFLMLELRGEILELSIISIQFLSLTSKIQYLKFNP